MSIDSHPILVTGATGNTGGAVVRHAAALGAPVRAAVRDPTRIGDSLGPGVEPVPFDFTRPETFEPALRGVRGLFLLRPPAVTRVAETLQRLIRHARGAGVEHVVFLSVVGADRARFIPHHRVEQHLRDSGMAWTFLRAGFFTQNLADAYRRDILEEDRIVLPAGDGVAAWVDARDLGEVAARVLVEGSERYTAPVLVGPEPLDFRAVADRLSEALDRPIRYQPVGVPRYLVHCRRRGDSWGFALVKAALHFALRFQGRAEVDPTLAELLHRRPRDLSDYIADHVERWQRPAGRGVDR